MAEKPFVIEAPNFATGYWATAEGRKPTDMSQPSANTRLTALGEAYTRPGYMDTGLDLNLAGKSNVQGFRMQRQNLTFFSGGTKVYYATDTGNITAPFSSKIDTGIALTDNTQTTFSEYAGDVFLTNSTDGLIRIAVVSLGTAAASSDGFLNLSTADAFRIGSSGSIRINGTDIPYTSKPAQQTVTSITSVTTTATVTTPSPHGLLTGMQVTITGSTNNEYNGTYIITKTGASTFTYTFAGSSTSPAGGTIIMTSDAVVLTGTVGSTYAAGTLALYVDLSLIPLAPKGSKNVFWVESANIIGVNKNFSTNYEAPRYTHFYADSADGHAAGGLAKAYTFGSGKSGNNLVGQRGALTNIIAVNDYLFLFTEQETYKVNNADVNLSTGARVPRLFTPRYGCANQFCAAVMEGEIVYLTNNKRIIKTSVSQWAPGTSYPQIFPDESFDRPLDGLLQLMDNDQSAARMWYWTKGRLLFITCKVDGQKLTLVYDNNVKVWLPPDTNKPYNSYFEVNGDLFATQDTDDTVYHVEFGSSDNLSPIEWVLATGIMRAAQGKGDKGLSTCDFEETEFVGSIAQGTNLTYRPVIDSAKEGSYKTMPQSAANFTAAAPIGDVKIGDVSVGGDTFNPDRSPCGYRWANQPSVGFGVQVQFRVFQDGGAASVKTYRISGKQFTDSFLTTH